MTPINVKQSPMYDPNAVQPMRDELVACGFEELLSSEDVDNVLGQKNDKTVLVVLNSVCGCAAGGARPGAILALQNDKIPDKIVTVFAGMERDAVDCLRKKYLSAFTPTSPLMALMKNGEVIHILHRFNIEGRSAQQIASELVDVFNKNCSAKGPSISPEDFKKVLNAKACGSKIPKFVQ